MSGFKLLLVLITHALMNMAVAEEDTVSTQNVTSEPVGVLSTSNGAKVDFLTANSTLGKNLIRNRLFLETVIHTVRERIPVRVVHTKGTGAFGYFEVTHDISDICKAKLFSEVGKKTKIGVRFSPTNAESGAPDSVREVRGFAVKFYTEEGNFDIVGFNTPMFNFKDPILFTPFVHAPKKTPGTNMLDSNTLWDLVILRPESLSLLFLTFGDRGIPLGYRYMPGFGIHTYQVVNECGDSHFVRFHFTPDLGIKNLRTEDAIRLGGTDPDFANRDLYNAIDTGDYPSWSVGVQVLSMDDVKNATFDVFDLTKALPLSTYPLKPLGRLVLNENPRNFFAEIEQLAFCPGNLVPGILGGPDKIFEARSLAYREAQNYRLGANFNKIKVNQPIIQTYTYNRDGVPPVSDNELNISSYYPNSFNGPQPYIEENEVDIIEIQEEPANNIKETGELYIEFTDDQKTRLVENIVASLGPTMKSIQERAIKLFETINSDFSSRVSAGLQNYTATDIEIEPLV